MMFDEDREKAELENERVNKQAGDFACLIFIAVAVLAGLFAGWEAGVILGLPAFFVYATIKE